MAKWSTYIAGRSTAEPLVGAAIGVGMTAEAAERGGADFLLALNAGRYRVMGAASIAAMLPLDDANAFTDRFARREILDRVDVPVFFGAAAFDPRLDIDRLISGLIEAGYDGVANFPTSIHFDGRFRRAIEEAGIGFSRECELLAAAREAGLTTFGYAKTRGEIEQMLAAGIDILCLNFGWNAGGARPVAQAFTLDEAIGRARRIFAEVRQVRPDITCVVEGGPIVNPDDMYRVCRDARADGYVGGSTLDRMPLEMSVMQKTSAFKAFNLLQQSNAVQSRETARAARVAGIVGQSDFVSRLLDRLVRVAATNLPVLIIGEPGLGRTTMARSLHALSGRRGPLTIVNPQSTDGPLEELLFGAEAAFGRTRRSGLLEARDATIVIENAGSMDAVLQDRLMDLFERGETERIGGSRSYQASGRLVLIAQADELRPALSERLKPGIVDVWPLRDRPEDIPAYARLYLGGVGEQRQAGGFEITPDGYRTLFAHACPENTKELRQVVEQAVLLADGPQIGSAEFRAVIAQAASNAEPGTPRGEREWILDALRRHRFRRGETASFLGVSRKTLYNKMRQHGLLD
jgi:predicted TIM-barrel enzyme/DNA-binding NtrC family response regulator